MVRFLAIAVNWLFAVSVTAQICNEPSCFDANVVAVADGDTVTVLRQTDAGPRQVRVRLTEIDAPERGQPWGTRARQALANKVFRKVVQVVASGEDRYGRLLARLHIGRRDVNRELVREGHAWVYRRYATENWLPDEAAARVSGLGLWSLGAGDATPPWEWRRIEHEQRRKVAATFNSESFSCGSKRYCREMASCAEARFHLETCGAHSLDGDSDGLPCESLCR